MSINKLHYVLQLADTALVLGHRISEWCGHGPVLEQDIAITNTSLDHLGQARSLYQYAASLYNELSVEEKKSAFVGFELEAGRQADEDTLPYLRDAWDYKNILLAEQPNEDWAYTIARSFFYDLFMVLYWDKLQQSGDEAIAAIAQKSLKEAQYHQKWSSEWVIRLGDGTDESHQKMQEAIDNLWSFSGEVFIMSEAEQAMISEGIAPNAEALKHKWQNKIQEVLTEATLEHPPMDAWMRSGGKTGTHTENLGFILAELQFVQRAYPNMTW